jgi:hypothetical protein
VHGIIGLLEQKYLEIMRQADHPPWAIPTQDIVSDTPVASKKNCWQSQVLENLLHHLVGLQEHTYMQLKFALIYALTLITPLSTEF